jgi:hypothetical protein
MDTRRVLERRLNTKRCLLRTHTQLETSTLLLSTGQQSPGFLCAVTAEQDGYEAFQDLRDLWYTSLCTIRHDDLTQSH